MRGSGVTAPLAVPFLDMRHMHEPLHEAILADIAGVMKCNAFVNGAQVGEFEEAFGAYCGVAHCVGVASGLDALRLALLALELEPGDEVLVPAGTFVATIEAVTQAGLTPVLVDVNDDDYGMDSRAAEAAISTRVRALMPVHLYGQVADMNALCDLATHNDLRVVEDAAQAHGAERDGRRAGSFGVASAFSFYPGKNLGAMGDAGALITRDESVARRARALREHGQLRKYVHEWEGYTARLDTVQAVVLLHKLPFLDRWNDERRVVARLYLDALDGVGDLRLPVVPEGSDPVWHLFVIRTAEPDDLSAFLASKGVATGRHYPVPIHLSPAWTHLGYPEGSFPISEALSRECLSLPIFPGMSELQVSAVTSAVEEYFRVGI